MKTRGQARSVFALEMVCAIQDRKVEFAKLSAGVPAMILQNGFGQTLAFMYSKSRDSDLRIKPGDKHGIMLDIIKAWLRRSMDVSSDDREFIRSISAMEQAKYLEAQQEVLRLLEWVKRYANAGL